MCHSTGTSSSESKQKDQSQTTRAQSGPSVWDAMTCNPPGSGCTDMGPLIVDNIIAAVPLLRAPRWLAKVLGLGDDAAKVGATVFKTGHYGERLAKEGVDVVRAEKAVAERISAMRPNMSTGAEVRGRFEQDGVLLEYRAYPLPNGSVNVGTIFPVKP